MRRTDTGRSIAPLTGIRGVAAAWIVCYHVTTRGSSIGTPDWFNHSIAARGWVAVDLFFILSGFVLMHGHGNAFGRITRKGLRDFYLQRIFRVYPLASVILLLIALLASVDPQFVVARRVERPLDFTTSSFIQTLLLGTRWLPMSDGEWNEPVWSLSVEVIGYVALPWLACLLSRTRRFRSAVILASVSIACLVILNVWSGRVDVNDTAGWSIVRMGFCFAGGMAFARARGLYTERTPRWAGSLATGAVFTLLTACSFPSGMVLALPATAALIFALSFGDGWICRLLSSRLAMWLGRISFPLYLLHVVPLLWIDYEVVGYGLHGWALALVLMLYTLVCLALAQTLHLIVERPAHRFARIFIANRVESGVAGTCGRMTARLP